MQASEKIWHDGALVPWEQATVHVTAHALHYGSSVFEGIRAYAFPDGPAVFRLEDHLTRLYTSCKIYRLDPLASPREALHEYGVELVNWDALPRAAAVIVAVCHDEFRSADGQARILDRLLPGGVFCDVKSAYDAQALRDKGYQVWRL